VSSSLEDLLNNSDLNEILTKSRDYGFLSPQPIADQIRHSFDFISLCSAIDGRVLDLGAGGGLPTFVWLYAYPERTITALDSMKKRCDFLLQMAAQYSSIRDRLEVINLRAEEASRDDRYEGRFDLIMARGFASPPITAECSSRLLAVGGHLVVSGRPDNEHERWSTEGLHKLGCVLVEVTSQSESHATLIKKTSDTPERFPRRSAAMHRQPLW
jgi:16S rRNA (guanine527-N7)-methyltransferase